MKDNRLNMSTCHQLQDEMKDKKPNLVGREEEDKEADDVQQ